MKEKMVQVPVRLPESMAQRLRVALVYSRTSAQELFSREALRFVEAFESEPDRARRFGNV